MNTVCIIVNMRISRSHFCLWNCNAVTRLFSNGVWGNPTRVPRFEDKSCQTIFRGQTGLFSWTPLCILGCHRFIQTESKAQQGLPAPCVKSTANSKTQFRIFYRLPQQMRRGLLGQLTAVAVLLEGSVFREEQKSLLSNSHKECSFFFSFLYQTHFHSLGCV